ncbi:hypothetical protein L1987_15805 [Smallanthus sonchifolius]|uniref:Uncharacterized protein n=1 Tax=Smallanthus sonchifolius TaxID=185202 RepID=A0ACB9J8P7_9ASTR|nr:hypothetical protein L1987_15805 [Smallanthus sonchifolius]
MFKCHTEHGKGIKESIVGELRFLLLGICLARSYLQRPKNIPAMYHDGYSKLRSWTYSSLDLYKHELLRVLYPVFIHCFMDPIAKGHLQEARAFFQ